MFSNKHKHKQKKFFLEKTISPYAIIDFLLIFVLKNTALKNKYLIIIIIKMMTGSLHRNVQTICCWVMQFSYFLFKHPWWLHFIASTLPVREKRVRIVSKVPKELNWPTYRCVYKNKINFQKDATMHKNECDRDK